jgi:hypothetical protein
MENCLLPRAPQYDLTLKSSHFDNKTDRIQCLFLFGIICQSHNKRIRRSIFNARFFVDTRTTFKSVFRLKEFKTV